MTLIPVMFCPHCLRMYFDLEVWDCEDCDRWTRRAWVELEFQAE